MLLFHPISCNSFPFFHNISHSYCVWKNGAAHSRWPTPPSPSSISSSFMPFKATRSQEHFTSPNLPKGRPWTTCRTSLVQLTPPNMSGNMAKTQEISRNHPATSMNRASLALSKSKDSSKFVLLTPPKLSDFYPATLEATTALGWHQHIQDAYM